MNIKLLKKLLLLGNFHWLIWLVSAVLASGCGGDSVDQFEGSAGDLPPFFVLNGQGGIQNGERIEASLSAGELLIEMYDEDSLANYAVVIGDVYSSSGAISHAEAVDYDYSRFALHVSLEQFAVNTEYEFAITLSDGSGHQLQRNFTFVIVSDPFRAVGSATANGWSIGAAQVLNEIESGVYEWQGLLNPGEIKFFFYDPNNLAEGISDPWCGGPWVMAASAGELPDLSGAGNAYQRFDLPSCPNNNGVPDNKWRVQEAGEYQITLDTNAGRVYFELLDVLDYYSELWLVGSATPGGWDLNAATPLQRQSPSEFSATVQLGEGELKITSALDYGDGVDWIHPDSADQPLTDTDYVIETTPYTDIKWNIGAADAGIYTITLDLQSETLIFSRQ